MSGEPTVEIINNPGPDITDAPWSYDVPITPESLSPPNTIIEPGGNTFEISRWDFQTITNYFNTEYHIHIEENYDPEYEPPEFEFEFEFPDRILIDYDGPVPDPEFAQVPEFDPFIEAPEKQDIPYEYWMEQVPFRGLLDESELELSDGTSIICIFWDPLGYEGDLCFDFADFEGLWIPMGFIILAVSTFISLRWAMGV